MKAWFYGLTPREQLYLLVMGAAVTLWLLYQLALAPVSAGRAQMTLNNQAASELLARVDAKAAQLVQLRAAGNGGTNSNLTTAITRTTELAGLPVRRVQPNSRGEVQVRFESVDFDALVRWLHRVEVSEGLIIVDASISQAGRSGGVNATLRVARAG